MRELEAGRLTLPHLAQRSQRQSGYRARGSVRCSPNAGSSCVWATRARLSRQEGHLDTDEHIRGTYRAYVSHGNLDDEHGRRADCPSLSHSGLDRYEDDCLGRIGLDVNGYFD